eukprot:8498436-Alexandrium_andersonii.AAC.1
MDSNALPKGARAREAIARPGTRKSLQSHLPEELRGSLAPHLPPATRAPSSPVRCVCVWVRGCVSV